MPNGWKYYNHAMIPETAPHEAVDLTPINNGSIWKLSGGGMPLLARWTSDFDCESPSEFWYCIKDDPFDINALKAKRRYEINKGIRNFEVRVIDPQEYARELLEVTIKAYSSWPEKYRPTVERSSFLSEIGKWKEKKILGGFIREENKLCAYAYLTEHADHVEFNMLRVVPECERGGINAAMVYGILEHYKKSMDGSFYILDGARSLRHETAFQDYLEKYFGFRKAYCRLNIKYRFPVNLAVKLLFPFRNRIDSDSKYGSLIVSVLKMEECRRAGNI